MRYLSLFSGIGGFELGLEGHECVGFSEIDKYAAKIYSQHFPQHHNYGDITKIKIDERKLPEFDLLCGGFPCQSFSIAGKRGGFEDTRGTLFFHIARIAKHSRPRLLFLENVKGLLSHDGGRTFNTIIAVLDELGYDLQWQVLNSKNFGVPQSRERVFIIGHLRGTGRPQIFPIREDDSLYHESKETKKGVRDIAQTITTQSGANATGSYIASTLTARQFASWNGNFIKQIHGGSQGYRVYDPKGVSTTLASQAGGVGAKTGLYQVQEKIRRLTPKECERLQGFPDGWTEGVSDTQRYKCIGNAVTVNVIQTIANKLK